MPKPRTLNLTEELEVPKCQESRPFTGCIRSIMGCYTMIWGFIIFGPLAALTNNLESGMFSNDFSPKGFLIIVV